MSKPLHPFLDVVASAYPAFFALLLLRWLLGGDETSLFDVLVAYFAVYLPAYVALLLEANIRYREEALSQRVTSDYVVWFLLFGFIIAFRSAWWIGALFLVVFLFFSLAIFLTLFFLEDWKRGRVERVDVACLVQGLAGLFLFHTAYPFGLIFRAAGEAFDLGAAVLWYFAMYPVLFYAYSAVRFALGRSCPAPLALAAVAYGVAAALENLTLLPTAALAIPAAMACRKDGGKVA